MTQALALPSPSSEPKNPKFCLNAAEWITNPADLRKIHDYYYEVLVRDRNNVLRHGIGRITATMPYGPVSGITSYKAQLIAREGQRPLTGNRVWSFEYPSFRDSGIDSIVAVRVLPTEVAKEIGELLLKPSYPARVFVGGDDA